jgi:hypothetical protein
MFSLRRVIAGVLLVGIASVAYGQGCAMCLTSAMSAGIEAMKSVNLGIFILLVPSFLIIVAMLAFTFLRRFH